VRKWKKNYGLSSELTVKVQGSVLTSHAVKYGPGQSAYISLSLSSEIWYSCNLGGN